MTLNTSPCFLSLVGARKEESESKIKIQNGCPNPTLGIISEEQGSYDILEKMWWVGELCIEIGIR